MSNFVKIISSIYLFVHLMVISVANISEPIDWDRTCCMLGQIAGDKGYHCQVVFYGFDILERNTNRAHNKKLSFYGRDRVPHFGEKLMIKFEKCLNKNGFVFHKCCYFATKEKQIQSNPRTDAYKRYLLNSYKNKTKN